MNQFSIMSCPHPRQPAPTLKERASMKIARLLVRFDHVAGLIINADHSVVRPAEKFCITNRVADCVRLAVPEATEWQRIGNQINAPLVTSGLHFVHLHSRCRYSFAA